MQKVLVVEDSKTYLQFVSSTLGKAGYIVLTSDNAWITNTVAIEHPDLILMDVQLGAVSGTAAVSVLRKRSFCKNTHILLHSSEPQEKLADMARACGADGYLCKDGREQTLLRAVKQILSPLEAKVH